MTIPVTVFTGRFNIQAQQLSNKFTFISRTNIEKFQFCLLKTFSAIEKLFPADRTSLIKLNIQKNFFFRQFFPWKTMGTHVLKGWKLFFLIKQGNTENKNLNIYPVVFEEVIFCSPTFYVLKIYKENCWWDDEHLLKYEYTFSSQFWWKNFIF